MTESRAASWHRGDGSAQRSRRLIDALRVYHEAEIAMRKRARAQLGIGDNELVALRYLVESPGSGAALTPTDIARHLGISTASTTTLLDRLERSGHVVRSRHASDRRSITLQPTPLAEREVNELFGDLDDRMVAATAGVTDAEVGAIIGFLARASAAVDAVAPEHGGERSPTPLPDQPDGASGSKAFSMSSSASLSA